MHRNSVSQLSNFVVLLTKFTDSIEGNSPFPTNMMCTSNSQRPSPVRKITFISNHLKTEACHASKDSVPLLLPSNIKNNLVDSSPLVKTTLTNDSAGKRVSFAATYIVRRTISRRDYTEQEKAACWFSFEEAGEIQAKSAKLVRLVESGSACRGNKRYCFRGLEGHTKNGYRNKMLNRATAFSLVLDEQDRQMDSCGVVNYDIIAAFYHQAASSCQLWASMVGLRDWKAAKACYSESDFAMSENMQQEGESSAKIIEEEKTELEIEVYPDEQNTHSTIPKAGDLAANSGKQRGIHMPNPRKSMRRNRTAKAA
jgi:hypothetical protein